MGMDTNRMRQISLQSGQALPADLPRAARVVLSEGEALLQSPAEWLGGTFVLRPPRRVSAPALLDAADLHAATALTAARILVQAQPSIADRLRAALDKLRGAWQRAPRPVRG